LECLVPELERIARNLEYLAKHPGMFNQDRINKIRNDIDVQREECMMKINKYSDQCLAELVQYENECNTQVVTFIASSECEKTLDISSELQSKCLSFKEESEKLIQKQLELEQKTEVAEDEWSDVSDSEEEEPLKNIRREIERGEETIRQIKDKLSNEQQCIFVPNRTKINMNEFGLFLVHDHKPSTNLHHPSLIHHWPMQGSLKDVMGKKNLQWKKEENFDEENNNDDDEKPRKNRYGEDRFDIPRNAIENIDRKLCITTGTTLKKKELTISFWAKLSKHFEDVVLDIEFSADSDSPAPNFELSWTGNESFFVAFEEFDAYSTCEFEFGSADLLVEQWFHMAITLSRRKVVCYLNGHKAKTEDLIDYQFLFRYKPKNDERKERSIQRVALKSGEDQDVLHSLRSYSDLKIYDQVLTENEIKENYNSIHLNNN